MTSSTFSASFSLPVLSKLNPKIGEASTLSKYVSSISFLLFSSVLAFTVGVIISDAKNVNPGTS